VTARVPSESYRLIRQAMRNRHQIVCVFDGLVRQACPIILGYSADGREVVFAYQFSGKTSAGGKLPGWRCFSLAKVSALQSSLGEWIEGESHKQPQNCVRFVDVDVNIPQTLTRTRPLPFGSPQLRPPRTAP
jgi:hypothetical protein